MFIETAFAEGGMGTTHAMIDAVAVPLISDVEEDEDPLGGGRDLFNDLDTFFR